MSRPGSVFGVRQAAGDHERDGGQRDRRPMRHGGGRVGSRSTLRRTRRRAASAAAVKPPSADRQRPLAGPGARLGIASR